MLMGHPIGFERSKKNSAFSCIGRDITQKVLERKKAIIKKIAGKFFLNFNISMGHPIVCERSKKNSAFSCIGRDITQKVLERKKAIIKKIAGENF